jgi:hypothetical protein
VGRPVRNAPGGGRDSARTGGLFAFGSESLFAFSRNQCSSSPRIGVRLEPESLFDFIQNPHRVWRPLDTPPQRERRAAPRAAERWPVAYGFPGASLVRTSWTADVSTRGARFGCAVPVRPGQPVQLTLTTPDGPVGPIAARVVRLDPMPQAQADRSGYDVAVVFEALPADQADRLRQAVQAALAAAEEERGGARGP